MMQFAIIIINGMAIFNTQYAENPDNEFTSYSLSSAESVFGGFVTGIDSIDIVIATLTIGWMLLKLVFSMLFAFFALYPTLVSIFHVPPTIAAVVAAAIYVLTALELFMLIFKPFRQVEP